MVAPPPRNVDAPRENYEFDWEKVAAFYFEPGQAAEVAKGTWHTLFNLGGAGGHVVCERHSQEIQGRAPSIPTASSPTSPGSIL